MSFILQAPLPSLQTTTVLPSPQFNDSIAQRHSVEIKHAMDGTKRSYVKSNETAKLIFSFLLSRMKALEMRAFIEAYYRAKIRLTTHRGEVWEAYFTNNPFEFSAEGRAGGWPGGEALSITLEFEGTKAVSVSPGDC